MQIKRPNVDSSAASPSFGMLRVFSRGQMQLETPIRDRVVLGRQRTGEPEPFSMVEHAEGLRVVIAGRSNQQVSRAHLQIDRDEKNNWVVTNSTRNCIIAIDPGHELLPGKQRVFDGAIRFQVEGATIVVDADSFAAQLVSLGTPNHRFDSEIDSLATAPNGQVAVGQARPLVETLGSHFDASQRDYLLEWLRMIAQLFRHVDHPAEYQSQALISIRGMIGASTVLVLEHQSASNGQHLDTPTLLPDWSLVDSIGFDQHPMPLGLPPLLARLSETGQSVLFRDSESPNSSAPVQQMIGTPILSPSHQPVAAFVAIGNAASSSQPPPSWGEIEASLMELIASGVSA